MGERLRMVREALGYTQTEFAERLKLTRNFISLVETGQRILSDRSINDVCREFNVLEQWLRTGEGDMFVPLDREDELTKFFGQIITAGEEDTRYRIIHALSRMDMSAWETLDAALRKLLEAYQEEQKNADP